MMVKIVIRTLKYIGITFFSILLLMFILPKLFPGKIEEEIKLFANKKLNGKLNFKETELSFFSHFPSLTLTLTDFSLNGSAPFEEQNLVKAENISFGVNLKSLIFDSTVKIDEIYVSDAEINVLVNKNGQANYNVYVASQKSEKNKDSKETSLKLDRIQIENTHLTYNDESIKMAINAVGFNYLGKGDFDSAIFDLVTEAKIDSFDFMFGGEDYLKNKKINADLITQINTNSLAFIFQQNNLVINQLPIDFKGKLNFLKNGYDIDFSVKSTNSNLYDFFTALPPQYVKWLEKTEIKGKTDLLLTLKGEYNVERNSKPDLAYQMKIRDGFVNYNASKNPASGLSLNLYTKLPSLDVNKLLVKISPLSFKMGKDYFNAQIETLGIDSPSIKAKINSDLDLKKLHDGIGIQNVDFSGKLIANVTANGVYDKKNRLFPVTKGNVVLQNGSLKTAWYPNPITAINLTANINDATGNYSDLKVKFTPASFDFEGKKINVNASLENFDDVLYDIKANGEIDLGRVYKVFTQENLDIKGIVKANLSLKGKQSDADKGRYNKLENSGTLFLKDITLKSSYLAKSFVINEGLFSFNQNKMNFKNFLATYGQSDFRMNGNMQNVINFVMSDKAILKGEFKVESKYLNVDEFTASNPISSTTSKSNSSNNGVVIVPPNLDFSLLTNFNKVNFEGLSINGLTSYLSMHNGEMNLKNTGFDLIGCKVKMNATYKNLNTKRAKFEYQIIAKDFDVKKAYTEVKMFRDMVSAAKSAEGIVSLDYKVAGYLNEEMKPIYPSLNGKGILSVKNVKMKGFKLFNAISKTTTHEGIKNPDLSEIDIKSSVKKNIMTLEQFKFKVAGFRPKIAGQTSLDGKLNLKMRLGLPPLGIIGIPLKISGTQDKPIVKITKKYEDLEETNFDESSDTIKSN
ncbi:AsmA-like C-terminal region-containing protein [Flavobacterium sp. H122]|uniref:AsmA-like C-terminal region-containing protein n=1 Tax=Flavobacterium sp. H122 TaxID=2529860 RepID=UPI0010AB47EF|nr:AsmA-like C-terminal region-containing protein [Flavobacterium sp. H122]